MSQNKLCCIDAEPHLILNKDRMKGSELGSSTHFNSVTI